MTSKPVSSGSRDVHCRNMKRETCGQETGEMDGSCRSGLALTEAADLLEESGIALPFRTARPFLGSNKLSCWRSLNTQQCFPPTVLSASTNVLRLKVRCCRFSVQNRYAFKLQTESLLPPQLTHVSTLADSVPQSFLPSFPPLFISSRPHAKIFSTTRLDYL